VAVAQRASFGARTGRQARLALVNGAAGAVIFEGTQVFSMMSFTVAGGRILEVEILKDPERLRAL
jgi:RNA polymerase sigma-70 factor (ECF subfamily)